MIGTTSILQARIPPARTSSHSVLSGDSAEDLALHDCIMAAPQPKSHPIRDGT